jgi:hypothetical protein
MKRHLLPIALLTLIAIPLLASCGSKPSPNESPIKPKIESSDLEEQLHQASPLATPAPVETPTQVVSAPGTGIVRGTLQQTSDTSSATITLVYLSGFVAMDSEQAGFEVVRMEPTLDPRATVNADGSFVFANIQPAKYALSTITPRGESVLLLNLDTGKEIIIEVKANETTNVGVIPVNIGF